MKTLTLIILLYLASCRPGRDIPEADISRFTLVSFKVLETYGRGERYEYKWYDEDRRLTWVVYSGYDWNLIIGSTMPALIRK